MAYIRNIKDNGGNVFYPLTHERAVKDSNGIKLESKLTEINSKLAGLESKSYVEAWNGTSTPVVANIPAGVAVTYNTTTYTGILAASASTIGKVYLVKNGNDYDRYITSQSGSSYSWSPIGSTEMDLSGYAKEEELGLLDSKVSGVDMDTSDADVHQVNTASDVDTPSGTRLRLVYYVYPGSTVSASCSLGKGVSCAVYDTLSKALNAGTNYLQLIQGPYTESFPSGTINEEGYLSISLCKSDESSFSAQDKADFLAATTVLIEKEGMNSKIDRVEGVGEKVDGILFYKMVQHGAGDTTPSQSGNRLSFLFKVSPLVSIKAEADWGGGIFASIWSNEYYALLGSSDPQYGFLQRIHDYTKYPFDGVSNFSGVLRIGAKKSDESAFTSEDITSFLSAFSYSVLPGSLLKEQIDEISQTVNDRLSEPLTVSDLNYGPIRHVAGTAVISASGDRYSIGFNIEKGKYIKHIVSTDTNSGIVVEVWNNWTNALVAPLDREGKFFQTLTPNSYVSANTVVRGITAWTEEATSGVLIIKFKKNNGTAITDEEAATMLGGLTVEIVQSEIDKELTRMDLEIGSLRSRVGALEENAEEQVKDVNVGNLFIGPIVQNALDQNGHISSQSTAAVSQKSALIVPYNGVVVKIKLPVGYCVKVYAGYSTTNMTDNLTNISNWLHDGDTYAFDTTYKQIYRLSFGKNDGEGNVTVEEIQNFLSTGAISITYENYGNNVVLSNSQSEGYVKNIMRKWYNVRSQDDSLTKMPTFTHLSDIHGDAVRFENFVKYSEMLGVDAALVSGDIVPMDGYYDRIDCFNEIIDGHSVMSLLCMGNHDARNGNNDQTQNMILSHNIAKYSLSTPQDVEYPTYYYKDFPGKSIRVITLNQYMPGQYNTNFTRYTQNQLNWLCSTLASTPAGYGVIIMMHCPEVATVKDNNFPKFWNLNDDGSTVSAEWFSNASPVTHIVDAFIGKTTLNYSYTEERSGGTDSISIIADFSSLASGVEFICYVTGHRHRDCIGYVYGASNKQLMCNICLGFALYGNDIYPYYAEEMDCPRGGKGATQDAFNVYAIDRSEKKLRIARVGSNMLPDFTMRDYMIIPYSD